ncbi:DUF1750-domain-containing protein [Cryphonectria parasitica EP155]|uniref:DUF1750-domain-containing protein n=1 Tax=Cryphonectria parasitica (strain ATCC 38755 / EP155) TaxID=660469 RepID=A0A9P4XWW4_CRYP1|nr:DUF1750-domain-containing protein [Cryphonectria parasitica EP155]KAF3762508.1 DUF1750-domain-containing protein [Cryphonectria parasitica EP155]
MADPSSSIHDRMLPHLHLVSTYRYPERTTIALHDHATTNWLLNMLLTAPKIARDSAPFFWTYLDAPRDGQIMLTWQPLQRMGTTFSSDGYVWPGPDEFSARDLKNGLILEVFSQRVGFRPGESVAAHARTRFRLVPTQNVPAGAPQVDPGLWLVHYGPSQQPIPAEVLPVPPAMQQIMSNRMTLQRGGQIARKEFMLADRLNWPAINPPREGRGHPMMAHPGNARNVPQQMAYPPPAKRSRTAAHAQQHVAAGPAGFQPPPFMPPPFIPFDDEEDTSTGDMFDHMTPRDISMARYTRNHEWMEEVLGSAYRIAQIEPADLGLGLQGELSSVTQGIFEAPGVNAHKQPPNNPVVGHLDPKLADDFKTRVADKIRAEQTEMAKTKARHEKQMAKFKANSILSRSEKELRAAIEETGPEFWRMEGKEEEEEESNEHPKTKHHRKVDEIVADIESALGRHIEVVSDVKRIQDGGYQEPPPEPVVVPMPPAVAATGDDSSAGPNQFSRPPSHAGSQNSGVMVGDTDVDMGGTTAGPVQIGNNPSPQTQQQPPPPPVGATTDNAGEDVAMHDSGHDKDPNTAPDQGTGSGDWVVVPKGGVSPGASASGQPTAPPAAPAPDPVPVAAPAPTAAVPAESPQPGDATRTGDSDYGDMNTAGEALSSYDRNDGDLGDGMDLGVEDSAFGDAVFGVEESRGKGRIKQAVPGQQPAQ